ncbi:MAG: glyceraldehyde 3-phosphate dehydrogenase NAD-binding domain-containing protein [Acidobacteriota bacterium]
MSVTRIGLMGFGRVGRDLFRLLYRRRDLRVAAIHDDHDPKSLEYLLQFDTLQGRFPTEVSVHGQHLYVDGQQIPLLSEKRGDDLSWGALGVDVVVVASGDPVSRASAERHLERGATRVVLCVPPLDPPDLSVVPGINDDQLRDEHRILSNSSCTAHAVAPILRILEGAFGIERAFLSTVHAYTDDQRLADVPAEEPRRGRAAAENIIPQATDAAEVISGLVPELRGRLQAMAMNVPVPNGSVIDLVCWHRKPVSITAVNEVVRTAIAGESFRDLLAYEDDPIVSSDILKTPHSGTFDALGTMVLGEKVSKTLTWFDNSWGYSHRVVELIEKLATLGRREVA